MSWATTYIEKLQQGETVSFRPRGNSMSGRVENGALVTVEPLGGRVPTVGDVVLCKVQGNQYLHLVKALRGPSFQIGNNHGGINGWIGINSIFGILTKIEP